VTEFLQHLVNGLSVGTIYALVALGYTMVYGVLKLINFAHGDVYMVGAFSGYWLAIVFNVRSPFDQNPPGAGETFIKASLVTLGAMAICGVLGFAIERFAYRPLRQRPRLTALITAIGVSFLLEYGFQLPPIVRSPIAFPPGPSPRVFPALLPRQGYEVFGVYFSNYDVVGFTVAISLMLGLQWIVYRTRFGTAMRAVSFDSQVAGLMGIAVNRIITWTFVLGSVLAAAAGIINAVTRPKIDPLFGLLSGLKAFVAAVLGGIGSVPGAMVGGMVLGLAEEYVAGYTSSNYRDAIAFTILILVLLVRPAGIFGRVTVEKV
jgi:branched-chain amino acid transport system permease protein